MHGRSSRVLGPDTGHPTPVQTGLEWTPHPSGLFDLLIIDEVVGAGFDRPSNAQYLTLRFPCILKLHSDRSIHDVRLS